MKRFLLLFLISFLIIVMEKPSLGAEGDKREEPRVGGPCENHRYEGRAEITSLRKVVDPNRKTEEEYEVRFKFTPAQEIKESFVQVEGREFLLEIKYSPYISSRFLEQHGIHIGGVFDAYLYAITKGTCTPVHFEFPSLSSK